MESFLLSVAKDLYNKYNLDMHDVCVLFPNRRAGIFFNKILAQHISKPVWGPKILTITDLMNNLSGLSLADPLTLIFNLFQVYSKEINSGETFDEFYYWGEMLINDFDDIDKYLADPKQLFKNLSDIKDIDNQFPIPEEQLKIIYEFWNNIRLDQTSSLKDNFISIWQKLLIIYQDYNIILRQKKIAYEGMLYRDVLSALIAEDKLKNTYRHFLIVGFNALNECEKELFKYLKVKNIASFYWDYDDYYINNTWHEAGFFMRENLKFFPQALNIEKQNSLTSPKNIEIISVPSNTGQTKMVNYFLEKWGCPNNDMTDTAIVMADEQLLLPLLSSIPPNINNVNVTLGYPLKFTPVASFFEAIVYVMKNVRKQNDGKVLFYHRDIKVLLNHPYIQIICPTEANDLLENIVRLNRVFISVDDVQSHVYLKNLFTLCRTSSEFIIYLKEIGSITVNSLKDANQNEISADFDRDYWYIFIKSLNRLQDIITKENIIPEISTLIKIIRKLINGLSVPFKGKPLAGLQIMGVLETRALDFNNVIMLSVNEGVMPAAESNATFIPYNLRRGFGLPTIEHHDSVYAYYFYRLMQRSNNIALLFNSQGGSQTGEMSRFIYQLKYDAAFAIKEQGLNFRISLSEEKNIDIPKTETILDILNRFLSISAEDKYLTPTALNTYLECTLRFYFRYVAGMREKEEITENIEGSMFGKLLHYAVKLIYSNFKGIQMHEHDFDKLINNGNFLESCVLKAFAAEFFKSENEIQKLYGNSILVKEVLLKYIRQILHVDKKYSPLTFIDFEKTAKTIISFEVNGNTQQAFVGGKIDRIDKTGDLFRVVDYKTGRVDYSFKSIEKLFEVGGKNQNKDILQILLYSIVLSEDIKFGNVPLNTSIYGLHDIYKQNFDPRIYISKNDFITDINQVKSSYINSLQGLLSEIFNPDIPFVKVTDKLKCEFCEFKMICHR